MVLGGYLEQALNKRRQREIAEEARVKAASQARRAKALEEQIAEAVDKTVNKVVAEAVALAVNKALPEAVPEAVDKAVEKAVEEFRPKWSAEARDEINEQWRDWNQRRMEAASKGESFPEPTPDVSAEAARFTMVVAEWLEGVLERRRQRDIAEATEKARQEGRQEAQSQRDAQWRAWNERRIDAEAKGEPFDEPYPDQTDQTC
jgi:hypothetical protein